MVRTWLEAIDYPRNRLTAPGKMVEMESFLTDKLRGFGYSVDRQRFTVEPGLARNLPPGVEEKDVVGLEGYNLVGGSSPILVGAHYDTVHLSPGADDNGSAVVAALAVAQRLAGRVPVTFAFFDMEEWNLIGARAYQGRHELAIIYESVGYFSDEPTTQKVPVGFQLAFPKIYAQLALNRFRGDFQALLYRPDARQPARRLARGLAKTHLVEVNLPVEAMGDFGRSDHLAFWERNQPAVMITDTANFRNPHYHLPSDRPATVDISRIEELVEATVRFLSDG